MRSGVVHSEGHAQEKLVGGAHRAVDRGAQESARQWIVERKKALNIIRMQIKLKPKLNERLYAARLEVAKW
jgi:hypothetical protein